MTSNAVLDKVLFVTHAAVSGGLLSDADSLAAGIEAAGWVRAVDGGHWYCPDQPSWSLLSSDHAPNLAVFLTDEDAATIFATGQQLARRLDQDARLERYGSDPGWPAWPRDDPRWGEWTGLGADWVMWDGGPARISLNVQPAYQPGGHRSPPHLQFQIGRLDTPPEGLPADLDRAGRIVGSGSPTARWYLAGEVDLPEHVIDALRHDPDSAVVAAVESGDKFRTVHAAAREHTKRHEEP
ncbi:hypothetical protein [Arthrobacter sp. B0490]|uniref:hypothetical protein n=1 Tax=Arthrobacter sp. B0490 TaxID=2058891 RepID=UPI000CE54407|nr:hypothetical protein [Arthrobacter sp. B0490]